MNSIPADMPITDILCLPVFNPNGVFHEKAALIAQKLCFEPYAILRGRLEKLAAELFA